MELFLLPAFSQERRCERLTLLKHAQLLKTAAAPGEVACAKANSRQAVSVLPLETKGC
jgi:hypothetical protein